VTKLAGSAPICLAGADPQVAAHSCNDVLSSAYATVFGLPLSLFGCLAYISMATFALAPLVVNSDNHKDLRSNLEKWTWLLLFAGATAMTVFSSYLMYLLAFQIKTFCLYCVTSALFSLSMLILTIVGHSWEELGQLFFTAIVVGMVTLIATLGIYSGVGAKNVTSGPIPPITGQPTQGVGWPITTTSGESELALADHLAKVGAKMYGAWWCPHCEEQKLLLGKEAFGKIQYVECDKDGNNSQSDVCQKVGIKSYPTWEIQGKLEPGVKTPQELAKLSGYKGQTNFKYSLR
jgi:uncharacterized membrane protein/glutaredoxin